MIQGLRTVLYPVGDITAAKEWYAKVLEREPYFDEPYYVGFEVGGFELGLVPDGIPSLDGVDARWGVPDAAVEVERLAGLGAKVLEPVNDVGDGIKVASVGDPFGNRFGIIENPHFDLAKVR